MKESNVIQGVKGRLKDSILLPALTYRFETCTWNRAQQMRVRAVEMSHLRWTCGVTKWDGEQ